jgi:ubiquinone/menaquinone biosynthesis C-methylase UbiE
MYEAQQTGGQKRRDIAAWFDQTYRTRGDRYLRPVAAYRIFVEILGKRPEGSLLDVACGLGRMLICAQHEALTLSGIDISPVAVSKASLSLPASTLAVASAEALPFPTNHFDYVTCLGSLERMLHPDTVLAEIGRVLKPGGKFVVMVRNSQTLTWTALVRLGMTNERGHQGADSLQHWRERLDNAGFSVASTFADQWPHQRWLHWFSQVFGTHWDAAPKTGLLPLRWANEFIFECTIRAAD